MPPATHSTEAEIEALDHRASACPASSPASRWNGWTARWTRCWPAAHRAAQRMDAAGDVGDVRRATADPRGPGGVDDTLMRRVGTFRPQLDVDCCLERLFTTPTNCLVPPIDDFDPRSATPLAEGQLDDRRPPTGPLTGESWAIGFEVVDRLGR